MMIVLSAVKCYFLHCFSTHHWSNLHYLHRILGLSRNKDNSRLQEPLIWWIGLLGLKVPGASSWKAPFQSLSSPLSFFLSEESLPLLRPCSRWLNVRPLFIRNWSQAQSKIIQTWLNLDISSVSFWTLLTQRLHQQLNATGVCCQSWTHSRVDAHVGYHSDQLHQHIILLLQSAGRP